MIGAVLMTFLGGRGTLWGPTIGALVLVPAQQYMITRLGASELYLVGYAAVFMVVLLVLPRGILPSLRDRDRAPARAAADTTQPGRGGEGGGVTALLEVEGLTRRFGGVTAVDRCSFSVPEGSITALVGPNGSGKTTAFNLITGYLRADAGAIRFAGTPVRRPNPVKLARSGLTRTFQQARIFGELTLVQNMVAALQQPWRAAFVAPWARASDRAPSSCSTSSGSRASRTSEPPISRTGRRSCSSSPPC